MADQMATEVVDDVLQKAAEEELKFKPTSVVKDLDVEIDIGNLLASDPNILNPNDYRKNCESFLKDLCRDNTQILINKIWELKTEIVEDEVVFKMPAGKTVLPREKKIPKAKPLTRWEEYAKKKGIQKKKKKENLVWDEAVKDWRPQHGYRRVNNEKNDWVLEVPENKDEFTDMFGNKKEAKKERVAKNELQRLKNIARTQKLKTTSPASGLAPIDNPSKFHVSKALHIAKSSTASLGKFTETLKDEKTPKRLGKKRKFEINEGDFEKEKATSMKIFENLQKRNPVINVNAAANIQTHQEERERSSVNKREGGGKKGQSKKTRGRKGVKGRPKKKITSRMKGKHT